jgi:hypothetical protein
VGIVYEICEIGDKFLFLKCGAAYSWSLCILDMANGQSRPQISLIINWHLLVSVQELVTIFVWQVRFWSHGYKLEIPSCKKTERVTSLFGTHYSSWHVKSRVRPKIKPGLFGKPVLIPMPNRETSTKQTFFQHQGTKTLRFCWFDAVCGQMSLEHVGILLCILLS